MISPRPSPEPTQVLLAEDDFISRRVLGGLLEKWGYEVEAVADGEAAWEALRRPDAPRLAVLDWMMPGLDGAEVCRRAKANGGTAASYLLLLTAREAKDCVVEGLRAGADDYIAKPYHPAELRARLEVGRRMVELQSALARQVEELQQALAHVRRLQGILPICVHCHKIRNDRESWQRLETYLMDHSEAQFSHGVCPECLAADYPE